MYVIVFFVFAFFKTTWCSNRKNPVDHWWTALAPLACFQGETLSVLWHLTSMDNFSFHAKNVERFFPHVVHSAAESDCCCPQVCFLLTMSRWVELVKVTSTWVAGSTVTQQNTSWPPPVRGFDVAADWRIEAWHTQMIQAQTGVFFPDPPTRAELHEKGMLSRKCLHGTECTST